MEEEALKVERGRERADFESGARLSGENPPRAYVGARSRSVQMFDRIVNLGAFKLGDRRLKHAHLLSPFTLKARYLEIVAFTYRVRGLQYKMCCIVTAMGWKVVLTSSKRHHMRFTLP